MGAQVAQHAADGVAVIVGAVLAVVDGVSAAAVRVSLEQAELAEKTLVIGQRDQAAREQTASIPSKFATWAARCERTAHRTCSRQLEPILEQSYRQSRSHNSTP